MSWIIGIDLGTTNSTMACLPKQKQKGTIEQLPILQQAELKTQKEAFFLPSAFYIPLEEEGLETCVGLYAKERGAELPDRVILSAKSWLCHEGIQATDSFLPLGELESKWSPVEVCASYLRHLKQTWNLKHPEAPFEQQRVLITVPASFNPRARHYVQEATRSAGYPEVVLIEEPLAAFYAWLEKQEQSWRAELKVGDVILIVDCGGGTTDFTLIEVQQNKGELQLVRQAVGEHLLLGGDNMDAALAYYAQNKLNQELDEWQFQKLWHACRQAKEKFLGYSPVEKIDLVIPGRGSSLIGSSLKVTLQKEEIQNLLIEGFFPPVSLGEEPQNVRREGLSQLGLPFANDPRITAHLAAFLSKAPRFPTAVLFNGGTLKPDSFRKRLLSLMERWGGNVVRELPEADLDYAVSLGAAYYGWVREGHGIRVRAGTTRSYFVGIAGSAPAVPGIPAPLKAVCIAPQGMEEGSEATLDKEECLLALGETAIFRFFSSSASTFLEEQAPFVGLTLKRWGDLLQELPPLETFLKSTEEKEPFAKVKLMAKVTELGVLELWCLASNGQKWKLELNVRKEEALTV